MNRDHHRARPRSPSRLYRNIRDGKLMGVCAGIADYFGLDPWLVRGLTTLSLLLFTLPTLLAYFGAAWWLDATPADLYRDADEREFWRSVRVGPGGTVHALRHRFREFERRLRTMEAYVTSKEFKLRRDFDGLE